MTQQEIQKEAEELYPHWDDISAEQISDASKRSFNNHNDALRQAYIAGRRKSLKELRELKAEILRRVIIIQFEPPGLTRETMIDNLSLNL